jgi:hypothetical protein
MSLALVMMVPVEALATSGSFAAAFAYVGMPWAQYIVALGGWLRAGGRGDPIITGWATFSMTYKYP